LLYRVNKLFQPLVSHSAAEGAEPTLFAALSPQARPAAYYGPSGFYELKGPVKPAFIAKAGQDLETARRLWTESEALTHVSFGAA
jgi:hypothetical protein